MEYVPSEVDFTFYTCRKTAVIHLGTNNITTDNSSESIAKKIAEVGKMIKRSIQAPRFIISVVISRCDERIGDNIAHTNNELRVMCTNSKWKFVNNRLSDSCLNGNKLHLNKKGAAY